MFVFDNVYRTSCPRVSQKAIDREWLVQILHLFRHNWFRSEEHAALPSTNGISLKHYIIDCQVAHFARFEHIDTHLLNL